MSTNLDVEYGSPKVIKTEYIVKKERVACVGGLTLFMSTLAICFTAGLYWNDTNGNVHLQAEHVSSVQQMAANEVNRNAQMATYEAATNARFEKMEKLIATNAAVSVSARQSNAETAAEASKTNGNLIAADTINTNENTKAAAANAVAIATITNKLSNVKTIADAADMLSDLNKVASAANADKIARVEQADKTASAANANKIAEVEKAAADKIAEVEKAAADKIGSNGELIATNTGTILSVSETATEAKSLSENNEADVAALTLTVTAKADKTALAALGTTVTANTKTASEAETLSENNEADVTALKVTVAAKATTAELTRVEGVSATKTELTRVETITTENRAGISDIKTDYQTKDAAATALEAYTKTAELNTEIFSDGAELQGFKDYKSSIEDALAGKEDKV